MPQPPFFPNGLNIDDEMLPLMQFQKWLLNVLEEHRRQSLQDIRMHFGAPMSSCRQSNLSSRISMHTPLGAIQHRQNKRSMQRNTNAKKSSEISLGSEDPEVREIVDEVQHTIHPVLNHHRADASSPTQADSSRNRDDDTKSGNFSVASSHEAQPEGTPTFLSMNLVGSPKFDAAVGFLIIANTIVILVKLEWNSHQQAVSLGIAPAENSWPNAKLWFDILEHVFNALFFIELVLRIAVFKMAFFKDALHLLDVFIVVGTSLQSYVLEPIVGSQGGGSSIVLIRMVRFIRSIRILRIVRTLTLFYELRVLIETWLVSFRALMWSMVLLAVLMMIGGLMLCQLLQSFVMDSESTTSTRRWVHNYYGSGSRSMLTMFEATLSGCWPNYFRRLIEEVSGWYACFVVLYICIVVFGFIRVITALFLKQTLAIASDDAAMQVSENLKSKKKLIARLHRLFQSLDVSGDGKLSMEEFENITANNKVKAWLQTLDLDVHDIQLLFDIMDDGDGLVTSDEFLNGVLRLKGHGRAFDVVRIMRSNDVMVERLAQINMTLQEMQVGAKGTGTVP